MKDPAMAAFFMRAAVAEKKAAAVRQRNEERGLYMPPVMILSVTSRCNLRCAGCCSWLVPRERKPELSEEWPRNVLKQASELGISIVLVVTCEDFIRRMREHGCKAFIFVEHNPVQTNSRLFRALQENRDKLMESGGGCALWRKPG